jgi:type VI protein secretion system component VasK
MQMLVLTGLWLFSVVALVAALLWLLGRWCRTEQGGEAARRCADARRRCEQLRRDVRAVQESIRRRLPPS